MTDADKLKLLLAKLQKGGVLTGKEMKFVEDAHRPHAFFPSMSAVAAHYGVTVRALRRWEAKYPEAFAKTDKGFDAAAIAAARKQFLATGTKARLNRGDVIGGNVVKLATDNQPPTGEVFDDIETLKARKMHLECQKLATQIDVLQGKYALVDTVLEEVRTVFYALREKFKRIGPELAYEVSGVSPAAAEIAITDAINLILMDLSNEDYQRLEVALTKAQDEEGPKTTYTPAARDKNGTQK